MMIICANVSFVDHVVKKLKTSRGGMYRVMETHLIKREDYFAPHKPPGQISQLVASRIISELGTNYGNMGRRYAHLLGMNPGAIDAWTCKICANFALSVRATNEERYWSALCGTLLAGGELANKLGATLDIAAMRTFLQKMYFENRKRLQEEAVEGGTVMNTVEALSGFFKHYIAETIWTDTYPMGKGKPKAITVLQGPPTNFPRPIQVQWAVSDKTLRICKREFMSYLDLQKIPPRQVLNGLVEHFQATYGYNKIAAGTSYQSIQEQLIMIPVPVGSMLEDQLLAHSTADLGAAGAVAVGEADTHAEVDLGLLDAAVTAAVTAAPAEGTTGTTSGA
jgi:hypothetical protein